MNRIISEQYGLFRLYQQLREELLATLTDADLAFTPGGDNPPLGRLCVEIGETERSYVDSFVHFSQNFDYRHADRAIESSVAGLRAWYEQLDAELYAAVAALSDDDVAQRHIDRGHGFRVPADVQLHIYQEALIIFYGKTTVYLKLLHKTMSDQWQHWIG